MQRRRSARKGRRPPNAVAAEPSPGGSHGVCPVDGKKNLGKSAAVRAARIMSDHGEQVGPYFCPDAGWWHIGHAKATKRNRRRR